MSKVGGFELPPEPGCELYGDWCKERGCAICAQLIRKKLRGYSGQGASDWPDDQWPRVKNDHVQAARDEGCAAPDRVEQIAKQLTDS